MKVETSRCDSPAPGGSHESANLETDVIKNFSVFFQCRQGRAQEWGVMDDSNTLTILEKTVNDAFLNGENW